MKIHTNSSFSWRDSESEYILFEEMCRQMRAGWVNYALCPPQQEILSTNMQQWLQVLLVDPR